MTGLYQYEAPPGVPLDGLVDPVDLPRTIRGIVRPNAKSIHSLAADIMRGLGATRDMYSKAQGSYTLLNAATAWSLARGVTDMYLGEIQDMDRTDLLESLEFAQRIGANLHLISGYGQTNAHAETIHRLGGDHRPFSALPEPIRNPSTHATAQQAQVSPDEAVEIPDDDWISFRPAYRSLWPTHIAEAADLIYLDAYQQARVSTVSTEDDIARLIASLWQKHGCSPLPATTVVRAVQAGMFRNGWNVRASLGHLERALLLRLVNPLTDAHYESLTGYADPWRAAATVLHAHHVGTEAALALKALDVQADGTIPSLDLMPSPQARLIIAAQRWRQLVTCDDDPPLFDKSVIALRTGIRKVTRELDLPLALHWTTQKVDRWQHNSGLKVTAI